MRKPHPKAFHYFLFNKPYGVLSQFTGEDTKLTLKNFGPFPPDMYPAGRLDADSEGLLLLTNDPEVKNRLTEPRFAHPRTYWVQVERIPTDAALQKLRTGVLIEGKRTRPAEVQLLHREPSLPPRAVPIRFRKTVPTCWLEITLREGRNRQVRKMTATVGHPTLRLVRVRIGSLGLEELNPGEMKEVKEPELQRLRRELGLSDSYLGSSGDSGTGGRSRPSSR
jgi:23S rRNA pseudouridine2457 synthase